MRRSAELGVNSVWVDQDTSTVAILSSGIDYKSFEKVIFTFSLRNKPSNNDAWLKW